VFVLVWEGVLAPGGEVVVADGVELSIWLYPNAGEPFAVTTREFSGEDAVLTALDHAFTSGAPLRLHQQHPNEQESTLVVNPANLVAARVQATAGATEAGQYL
jgi:hypothetical protein